MQNNLQIIKKLILGQKVTIKYKILSSYVEKTGMLLKIDLVNEYLHLPNIAIPFANIITIET